MDDGEVDTGGPAFPWGEHGTVLGGMTIRDYFAIHCDQPGEQEIATAAGFELKDGQILFPVHPNDGPGRASKGMFRDWYRELTQQERMSLYAKVRYQLADAMLAERAKATQ